MNQNVEKCPDCGGDGWYQDHAPSCTDSIHVDCPIQVQCEKCQGTGKIEEPKP